MRKLLLFIAAFLCHVLVSVASKARYDNYKVVQVNIETSTQLQAVQEMASLGYIFVHDIPQSIGDSSDLIIPPHKFGEFEEIIGTLKLDVKVLTTNLQHEIDMESANYLISRSSDAAFSWTQYHTLEEIYAWLDTLIATHPNTVTSFTAGKSFEDRLIRGVKISYKPGNPTIFVESNIHAREWITSATATWIINELLTSQNATIRDMVENIDWYFLPIANPDGYAYTHKTDRLWRKTRQRHSLLCRGADPNRNWDSFFGGPGTSKFPCSETYCGPSAFSEPETKAISDYLNTIADKIQIYLSFHSYSQLLMYPYGVKAAGPVKNEDEIRKVGEPMVKKLAERYGTQYAFGDIATTIYEAAGSSLDWIKSKHDTPLPFVFEFRDTGKYGFVLPPEQIVPNSLEVFDSLVEMVKQARAIGYLKQTEAN